MELSYSFGLRLTPKPEILPGDHPGKRKLYKPARELRGSETRRYWNKGSAPGQRRLRQIWFCGASTPHTAAKQTPRLPGQRGLLNTLLWRSKFIFLAQDLAIIKPHQGLRFFGQCKLSKFLKGKKEKKERWNSGVLVPTSSAQQGTPSASIPQAAAGVAVLFTVL